MSPTKSNLATLEIYLAYLKKHPTEILINTMFMMLIPIQDIYLPHCYGTIISNIQSGNIQLKPFIIVLVTMICLQIGFYIGDYHDSIVYPKLQEFIRANILTKIIDSHETCYKELHIGEIISALVKVPTTMCTWFERIKNTILPFFLTFIIAVIYFLMTDMILGISLLIMGCIFALTLYLAPKGCSDTTQKRDSTLNYIYEEIDDILRNLFSIYGSNKKDDEIKRSKEFEDIHQELFRNTVGCIFRFKVWITPIAIIFLCIFISRCYILLQSNRLHVDRFVPVFIIMLYILNSMIYTNDQFRDIVFEWGILKSIEDIIHPYIMDHDISKKEMKHNVYNDSMIHEIIQYNGIGCKNIIFQYENAKYPIFNDLSIHIPNNQCVVITGDIGSGKSTLLKLLLGYYKPRNGFIYYNKQKYDDMSLYDIRKKIGYVPQVPILFNRSIIENITYGNDTPRQKIIDFLEKYDIMKEFTGFENGLDTKIGKNGSLLSGGQRQILWCIRVILSVPEVVIFDEPTSSIDTQMKDILLHMLEDIIREKTVIMVTHDEYLISKANRRIHMKSGTIISDITI